MKLFSILTLAMLVISSVSFASDSPFDDPVGENDQTNCESYEPGCERATQEEWEEPSRPNYPENPDDPTMPGDF